MADKEALGANKELLLEKAKSYVSSNKGGFMHTLAMDFIVDAENLLAGKKINKEEDFVWDVISAWAIQVKDKK